MGVRRSRARRKFPSEKQKPFFDKQSAEQSTFFGGKPVQRKLNFSKANDAGEKEADSAAKKVTQVQKEDKEKEKPVQKADDKKEEKPVQKADKEEKDKPVQKAEEKKEEKPVQKADKEEKDKPVQKAEEKKEEKPVQKADKEEKDKPVQKAEKKEDEKVSKAEKKEEDKPVQAKQDPRIQRAGSSEDTTEGDTASSSFESLLAKRKGMGFVMPDDLRKDMEGKFRTSFKDVRIHTDKEAGEMCEAIHALAFAHGYDIYFNEGMYNPDALTGRELLAHELAHVVQQNG
jgi:uncharacterized protein DUF4157